MPDQGFFFAHQFYEFSKKGCLIVISSVRYFSDEKLRLRGIRSLVFILER